MTKRLWATQFGTRVLPLAACLAIAAGTCWAGAQPKPRPPIPRHSITGRLVGMAPGHRATVRATGREPHNTISHADGNYILRGLRPGTYTVRASHPGYHFTPNFHTVAITNHDVDNQDFVAHPNPPRKKR